MARLASALSLSDYLQLMKLRIDALLLLVAAAGYVATSGTRIDPVSFGLLMVTGLLAASGASATNHYLDRDLDAVMRRTSARPLPSRRIEPAGRALAFGLGLTSISLGIAALWINPLTAAMIGLGYAVYVGVYTMGLKRTHVSNIVIGGFAGSCPALAGSAAAANAISLPAALIALLVFLWTPGHFWALAYRNREDYRRARLPMLPAVRDEQTSAWAIGISTAIVALSSIAFAFTNAFHDGYLVVAVVAGAILLYLAASFVRHPTTERAWAGYRFSGIYLAILLVAMMADALLPLTLSR
ncbi:MAG TPA: heme o synthase [Thermoplasmata archaeon]|nr:heme o synthase [Thermoplasmata archaeon]